MKETMVETQVTYTLLHEDKLYVIELSRLECAWKPENSSLHRKPWNAESADPSGFEANANVKLFRALGHLILETVPGDLSREEYRQGKTMGPAYRHWRRAKIGRRFRLFFRYDSKARVIVFAWVNDEQTLRSSGSKSDPYAVFQKMLDRGNPPDGWDALVAETRTEWAP